MVVLRKRERFRHNFSPIERVTAFGRVVKSETEKEFFETEAEPAAEVGSGLYFAWRAEKELKRAERYLSFVSLITFECIPTTASGWDEELKKKAAEVVERCIRETDILGISNANRLAVLLVETPRRGAERAADRIAAQLLELCLKEKGKSKLEIKVHSFPEDPQGKENFLLALEKLR